ncbi:MAG: enoyl-CoA hydratase, partial [Deltaproteobacteria bacterium]|jgi:2-(1,2-epoxy-1,2-dihydrophenyl)acetyl-CoA isomerase|nr:enoyl-CoA hydratase [Deltaproteobacteria bacterium]
MDAVIETFDDGIYTITLNRPDKKNAMDSALLKGLYDALKRAHERASQVIVIRGAGKAFCAGGDLVEFNESPDPGSRIDDMADCLHQSIMLIRNTGAIVIAVVEGVAVGAGLGLSLACDLTLAAKNTIMNLGYRRIGLTPDGGGSISLPRLIGAKRFNELYLFSANVTMTEALALGLVNFVCDEAEIEIKLSEIVKNLLALPMETITRIKNLVNHSMFSGLEEHLDMERQYVKELAEQPLFKERLSAFFRKR